MLKPFAESDLEREVISWFGDIGYDYRYGPGIAPDEPAAERLRYDEGFLPERLRSALARLNPDTPPDALEDAFRKITLPETLSLIETNHAFHLLVTEGVPVQYRSEDGRDVYDLARVLDFEEPANNDWLVVNQFTVIEGQNHRRADVVVFVNGLPLAVIELKNPADEQASAYDAFKGLRTYQQEIPALFHHNEALVASDGIEAKAACVNANWEWFVPWKTIEGDDVAPAGVIPLEVLIRGVFDHGRFLDLVRNFVVFETDDGQRVKKMARYHQFHAVNKAVDRTLHATAPSGDRRIGVVWHTQGSGKSLTMAFYAGKVIRHPAMENPTLVVLTDRNDLDDQLLGTFSACKELLRQDPVQAENRDQLQELICPPFSGQSDGSGFGQRTHHVNGWTALPATADGDTSGLPPRVAPGTL